MKYAISYDLNTDAVKRLFPRSLSTPYSQIDRFLTGRRFYRVQGSLFYGPDNGSVFYCVNAIRDMCELHPWFPLVVKDLRLLTISANDDLREIVPMRLPF